VQALSHHPPQWQDVTWDLRKNTPLEATVHFSVNRTGGNIPEHHRQQSGEIRLTAWNSTAPKIQSDVNKSILPQSEFCVQVQIHFLVE
jgi:hypothetical protein